MDRLSLPLFPTLLKLKWYDGDDDGDDDEGDNDDGEEMMVMMMI